jgi:hypothetical protein
MSKTNSLISWIESDEFECGECDMRAYIRLEYFDSFDVLSVLHYCLNCAYEVDLLNIELNQRKNEEEEK